MDDWNEKVCTLYPYDVIIRGLSINPKVIASMSHRLFIGDECVSPSVALYKLLYIHDKPIIHAKDPLETLIDLLAKVNISRVTSRLREIAVNSSDAIIESRLGIADALFRCAFKTQTPYDDKEAHYNPVTQLNYKTPGNFPYTSTLLRVACHDQQTFYHYLFTEYGLTRDITDDVQILIKNKERLNIDTQRPITLEELRRMKYYHEKTGMGTNSQKLYYRILPFLESFCGKYQRKAIPKAIKTDLWDKYYPGQLTGPCYTCGKAIDARHFEAGHVIPASEGGPDTVDNLRPICKPCNASMSNMELYEYKQRYHTPLGVVTKRARSSSTATKTQKTLDEDFVMIESTYDSRVEFHRLYRTYHADMVADYRAWCSSNLRGFVLKEMEDYLIGKGCEKETDGKVFYTGVRLLKRTALVDGYTALFDKCTKKYKEDGRLYTKVLRDLRRLGVASADVKELMTKKKDEYPKFVLDAMTKCIE